MYLTHPARPIHGGPLDIAITKPLFLDPDIYGDRRAELKLNGFRVEADRAEKIPTQQGKRWFPATVYSVRSFARVADRKDYAPI